jgi:glycine/D-amino acid oxidase-like deaminating enzyme
VSADGAPFIGPLASAPNVFVASGHGMIGTSMAMGTADLIARYLRGERISEAELALTPNR